MIITDKDCKMKIRWQGYEWR